MQLKQAAIADLVAVRAFVVRQSPGQTLLWTPGIGGTGTWSSVNTAECDLLMSLAGAPFAAVDLGTAVR